MATPPQTHYMPSLSGLSRPRYLCVLAAEALSLPEASLPISARASDGTQPGIGRAVLFKRGVSVFPDLCGTQEEMDYGGK